MTPAHAMTTQVKAVGLNFFLRLACMLFAACVAMTCLAQGADEALDHDKMMRDIEGMLDTNSNHMHLFVPSYATPERMAQFAQTPQFMALRSGQKANALAMVGGSALMLSLSKPSDVLTKITAWFPSELAQWRAEGRQIRDVNLYGPLPGWHPQAMAFVSLWNCVPQLAWWHHDRNPFALPEGNGPDLVTRTPPDNDAFRYDFAYCLGNDNGRGYDYPDTAEDRARIRRFREEVAVAVRPVLIEIFSGHLRRHRCSMTGPDDCVLSLRLWSEIAPEDPNLAAVLQDIEADVAPDAPLPAMLNPSTDPWSLQESDGRERFNAARRNAAYLRAKLASVAVAHQYWTDAQVQQTLRQLSAHVAVFNEPFVHRYRVYAPGYYSKALSPFDVFYKHLQALPALKGAIEQETRRLGPQAPCEVVGAWFFHEAIHARYVLDLLHMGSAESLRCGVPPMAWLVEQTSAPEKGLLYGYLAFLPYAQKAERQALLNGLTNSGSMCAKTHKKASGVKPSIAASPSWQKTVCEQWKSSASGMNSL